MKLQDITNFDKDDFLGLLGLQTKHRFSHRLLGTLGAVGVGLLIGAGVALLWAPKPGSELRQTLRTKLQNGCTDTTVGEPATDGSPAAPRRA